MTRHYLDLGKTLAEHLHHPIRGTTSSNQRHYPALRAILEKSICIRLYDQCLLAYRKKSGSQKPPIIKTWSRAIIGLLIMALDMVECLKTLTDKCLLV